MVAVVTSSPLTNVTIVSSPCRRRCTSLRYAAWLAAPGGESGRASSFARASGCRRTSTVTMTSSSSRANVGGRVAGPASTNSSISQPVAMRSGFGR